MRPGTALTGVEIIMLTVKWVKLATGGFPPLKNVGLSNVTARGVYVIWKQSAIVRVGQGDIKSKLTAHRNDAAILTHGDLYVSWAVVREQYMDGVERFLANHYRPLIGDAFPDVHPIQVNLVA